MTQLLKMHLIVSLSFSVSQVSGKFGAGHNPFDRGCMENCCSVMCGPLPPSFTKYTESGKPRSTESSRVSVVGGGAYDCESAHTQHVDIDDDVISHHGNRGRELWEGTYQR